MIDPRKAGTVVPASNFQKKFAEKPTHTRFSRIKPHGHAHRCAPKRGGLRAPRWLSPARAHCALASLACRLTEFRWRYSYSAAGWFPGLPRSVRRARGPPWCVHPPCWRAPPRERGCGGLAGVLWFGGALRAQRLPVAHAAGVPPRPPKALSGLRSLRSRTAYGVPIGGRSLRSR